MFIVTFILYLLAFIGGLIFSYDLGCFREIKCDISVFLGLALAVMMSLIPFGLLYLIFKIIRLLIIFISKALRGELKLEKGKK